MKQVLVHATISVDAYLLGLGDGSSVEPHWASVEEAAEGLGVSRRQIRRLCKEGKLRHKRVGKLYRVHTSEFAEEPKVGTLRLATHSAASPANNAPSMKEVELERPRRSKRHVQETQPDLADRVWAKMQAERSETPTDLADRVWAKMRAERRNRER